MLCILGDMLYSVLEYFLGYWFELSSDMFVLVVMIYYVFSGIYFYDILVVKVFNLKELYWF